MRIATTLENLEGVISIADDILVYGEGDTDVEASIDHDQRLIALMERCMQKNLKLNPVKFRFKLPKVKYMGHTVSTKGMSIDTTHVDAISKIPCPQKKRLCSAFWGL